MRIGRDKAKNDLVLDQGEVSREHALIFCRQAQRNGATEVTYCMEDFSRYGTWILEPNLEPETWQQIHHQEMPLKSGTQIKFGSLQSEALEFMIQPSSS